jgi:hypothetical protein
LEEGDAGARRKGRIRWQALAVRAPADPCSGGGRIYIETSFDLLK